MKKIVGYTRVSSDSQIENTSIDEQKERIQAYCKAQGWQLVKIYCDEGLSGSNTKRPDYQEMLQAIQAGEIDYLLVVKADRIHRNLKNLLIMIDDHLEPYKTSFISVTESFDTSTPHGKTMLQMMGSFSELERSMINARTRDGRVSTAKKQKHAGGQMPYGYEIVPTKEVKKISIVEVQATIVKWIFDEYINGRSTYWIAKKLNQEGIETKGRENKRTGLKAKWTPTHIRTILLNETYTGISKYDGKKEAHNIKQKDVFPSIISRQKWNKAQTMFENNKRTTKEVAGNE